MKKFYDKTSKIEIFGHIMRNETTNRFLQNILQETTAKEQDDERRIL